MSVVECQPLLLLFCTPTWSASRHAYMSLTSCLCISSGRPALYENSGVENAWITSEGTLSDSPALDFCCTRLDGAILRFFLVGGTTLRPFLVFGTTRLQKFSQSRTRDVKSQPSIPQQKKPLLQMKEGFVLSAEFRLCRHLLAPPRHSRYQLTRARRPQILCPHRPQSGRCKNLFHYSGLLGLRRSPQR